MLNFSYYDRKDKNKLTPQEGKVHLSSHLRILFTDLTNC